ncbi:reverse transcriptase, partial [Caerostris darwini]
KKQLHISIIMDYSV